MKKGQIYVDELRKGYEIKIYDLSDFWEEESIPWKGSVHISFLPVSFPQQATLRETRNLQSD